MLRIDRLRLSLPPGLAHRAENVGRLVADELASLSLSGGCHVESLNIPALEVAAGADDRQVAGQVAGAIHQRLQVGPGRGGRS